MEGEASDVEASPYCRVCYEGGGDLIRPCRCSGSMAWIHEKCLRAQLEAQPNEACTVCKTPWHPWRQTFGALYGVALTAATLWALRPLLACISAS
ncbi:hypothetical protein CTAYLR_004085 [Chrysophaeum taylorii]|uniref:RING-CH-type domain-containing protein n=1 Tax=Chrysophaeum taylorii TaxID=2483200 RepID=A0AAD7UDM6_9STRA|nr:hypothetical protein CTAYLR_004085 [Chrysophaeum taylorii]